jgi:hypothetical protein
MNRFRRFLDIVEWASPVLKLLSDSAGAISDGYSEKLLSDPGHVRIKYYDKLILILAWICALLIVIPSVVHYYKTTSDELVVFLVIFFPHFTNIFITILLYIVSIVLAFYNKNRQNIIRRINEKAGAW